jgi:uncharacterized membrane protein YhaH (DUF805 family)
MTFVVPWGQRWPHTRVGKLAVLLVIITIFVLLNVFQTPIVHALEPAAKWLYKCVMTFMSSCHFWPRALQNPRRLADAHRHSHAAIYTSCLFSRSLGKLAQYSRHYQLFGQEVVLMMIGLAWGPGIGMAIAAAGTLIGELGTF